MTAEERDNWEFLNFKMDSEGFFLPNIEYAWCSIIILTRTNK
jgi:hypothetical protein